MEEQRQLVEYTSDDAQRRLMMYYPNVSKIGKRSKKRDR